MKAKSGTVLAASLAASVMIYQTAYPQSDPESVAQPKSPVYKPADNTANNKTDPSNAVTADDSKNDRSDVGLTQQIRKSVMADKSLSTYAHNVKIVAVDGTVTLNGVVRDNREKHKVAMMAQKVAGKDHVVNDLKIAPPAS